MDSIAEVMNREAIKPFVKFVRETVDDAKATLAAGRYVGKDVDFVHVTPAYSKDVFKQKVSSWFEQKKREVAEGRERQDWVNDWMKMYEMFKNGQEMPLEGSPIKGWGVISPAMQETLIRMNILTVESLAAINDEGQKRIGMGALDLKNMAIAWLSQLNDKGKLTVEMAALQKANAEQKLTIDNLVSQVNQLKQMVQNPATTAQVNEVPHGTIVVSDILETPEDEMADLRAEYIAKTGKQPHHLWKLSTLREKLAEV